MLSPKFVGPVEGNIGKLTKLSHFALGLLGSVNDSVIFDPIFNKINNAEFIAERKIFIHCV